MINFNIGELFSGMESRLLEKAKSMDIISDVKELDKPITNYITGFDGTDTIADRVSGCPIEGHNGHWEEDRGNSKWIPDGGTIPTRYNPDGLTWDEILEKHVIDGIEYKDGEPDFSPVSKGEVTIDDFTDDRISNFTQADEALAKQRGCSPDEVKKWREENGYTWHECRDCETMQKVPRVVHNNMDHSGGISEYKKMHNHEGGN